MNITSLDQLDFSESYTYADYLTWTFDERLELIRGKIYDKSESPTTNHQKVSRQIGFYLYQFLEEIPVEVFYAPFDVRLSTEKDYKKIITVVQPDICVICDPNKIDEKGCAGSPDIVVEIVSPGNTKTEMKVKFDLYEESKIQEYWIVQPIDKTVLVYQLEKGKYINHKPLTDSDILTSKVIPGFELDLEKVFK